MPEPAMTITTASFEDYVQSALTSGDRTALDSIVFTVLVTAWHERVQDHDRLVELLEGLLGQALHHETIGDLRALCGASRVAGPNVEPDYRRILEDWFFWSQDRVRAAIELALSTGTVGAVDPSTGAN